MSLPRSLPLFLLCALASSVVAEDVFEVTFEVVLGPGNYGSFTVEVHPEWAPLGAARFKELVEDEFFTGVRFFRVVPGFVVQWGLHGKPAIEAKWSAMNLPDEPVITSNTKGTLAFAKSGPNTRTTQMFINYGDNKQLDGMDFPAFAKVIRGMDVVEAIYSGYGEQPNQGQITAEGNKYLKASFPNLSYIKDASVVDAESAEL